MGTQQLDRWSSCRSCAGELERLVAASPPAREVVRHRPRSPLVYEALFRTRRSPRSTEVRLSAQAVAARAPARGTWSCSSNHSQHIQKRLHLNLVFSSTSTSTGVYGGDAHVSAVESLCPLLEGTPAPEWGVDAGVNVNEEPPASVHRERTRPRR